MRRHFTYLLGLAGAVALAVACSATSKTQVFEDNQDGDGEDVTGGSSGEGGGGGVTLTGGFGGFDPTTTGSTMSGGTSCVTAADVDDDGDGFTDDDGDCNDCDANVNPGAIEVIVTDPIGTGGAGGAGGAGSVPEPADEDCDGQIDNPPGTCDESIPLGDADPMNAARAVDLCKQATPGGKDYGVLTAQYVRANGTPAAASLQTGILEAFGANNVQRGARMLGLSSGHARSASQPNACGALTCSGNGPGTPPAGFPQDVPGCSGSTNINDDVGLEVHLRAPKNATGYKFNFRFFSFEYPEWVCTSFNDQFIALVSPPPVGSINGNISFDSQTNPVSVNVAFFDTCAGCPLGTGDLSGTGFDVWNDAGATSWLVTTAPIGGGEKLSLRFAIWDTGDSAYDSTVLVDGFDWIANGGTVVVGTEPDPIPE